MQIVCQLRPSKESNRVFTRAIHLLVVLLALVLLGQSAQPAAAQSGPLVAFQNAAGQLVVTSADGVYRWVLTNPGETLSPALGFRWSQNGSRLFFAVDEGGEVSLRSADVAGQAINEIGRVTSGGLSGGEWTPDHSGVLVAANDRLTWYPVSGQAVDILAGQGPVSLRTPAQDSRFGWRALSPDARTLIYRDSAGTTVALPLTGGASVPLTSGADPSLPGGLWAEDGGLVAVAGANEIVVFSPVTGVSARWPGASAVPPAPLLWWPGTSLLLVQDGAGAIRSADMSCLRSGPCDPFPASFPVLAASARGLRAAGDWLVYLDGDGVFAVPSGCLSAGSCAPVPVAASVSPGSAMDARGGALAYTAYTADPNNPSDREARVVDLACLNSGSCAPQTVAPGAQAGGLSPDGRLLIVSGPAGLLLTDRTSGAQMLLSDPAPGQTPASARWNG